MYSKTLKTELIFFLDTKNRQKKLSTFIGKTTIVHLFRVEGKDHKLNEHIRHVLKYLVI